MKLYNLFNVVSNKTVRPKEKSYKMWSSKEYGKMTRTNRGYFIDGKQVDSKAVDLWFELRKNDKTRSKS